MQPFQLESFPHEHQPSHCAFLLFAHWVQGKALSVPFHQRLSFLQGSNNVSKAEPRRSLPNLACSSYSFPLETRQSCIIHFRRLNKHALFLPSPQPPCPSPIHTPQTANALSCGLNVACEEMKMLGGAMVRLRGNGSPLEDALG